MGKKCVICHHSNDDLNGVKVSFYCAPKEADLFAKWKDAVSLGGITLKKSSYVCQKHFKPEDRKDEVLIRDSSGKVLFQVCMCSLL